MSLNNSPEIVTQKELEPVLQNKAFDAKKFLELYEEWKQTHDAHTFALLRGMHEDAGYNNKNIIFGAEKEMHEIAAIIKKFQDEKGQIMAVATSGTALVAAGNPPMPSTRIPADSSYIETEYKYELKKYAGYALRELTKNGKTISDLQEKLKEKKFYSGEITGKFDEATLDAVFAFQKSVKHPVYGEKGIDGLVGSVETIPALFGIVSKPNTGTTTVPKAGTQKTGGTDSGNSTGPSSKKVPSPDVVTEGFLKTEQKIVFKDGAYYLTGPKGAPRKIEMQQLLVNLSLPKNAPENLSTSVAIIDDFSLVLDAYIRKNPKEKAKYDTAIQAVQKLFADSEIQTGKKIIDITTITQDLFSNSRILPGDTDLRAINSAFRITNTKDRHLAVLQFVRDRLDQSDIVLEKLMQSNKDYFAFPKDEEILKIGDLSAAGLSLGARQKVEDAIRKARVDAASNWNKNHKEYLDQYKKQNPETNVDEETARVWNEKLLILSMAKREIMYQKLYNKTDLTKEQTLMQDIMGAGTMKMSDRSWEVSQEVAGMIAMEAIAIAAGAVTAGTATVAINAAMLGRNAYRGVRAIEAYNAASKTRQVLTTSLRILGSGAGFEAGGATMRSYIENGDFTSMHSKEGYAQSIAMMGVMGGIGKLITAGKLGKGLQFKEGAGMAKNIVPFVGQTVIEGSAIFGTSAAIGSVVFDRRDNWTMEQMAQAMLMATIFKGAGRVLARKGPNGEPEVHTESTAQAHHGPTQTQRGGVAAVENPVLNTGNTLKTIKDYHITGDALYERVTRLGGGKKIEIEGLPGYTIGMTSDGRKLEIFGPKGKKFSFYKDQLEKNLEGIYNLQKRANPTIDIPVQPTESVSPANNGASSHSAHPIPEAVVPVAPHVAPHGAVSGSTPTATPHDTHVIPPVANTAQAHATHQESSAHHADHGAHPVKKSSYEFKGWKTIDTILMGDNRKFRELLPFADNNVFQGTKKLATGEMRIIEAMHNSAAWVQNQTFSQIYREMAKPWRGNPSAVIKNAGDNIRTVLLSGESGKWMSADRLGKLGIVMSAGAIDYVTSDEFQKNSDGLVDAVEGGAGFIFNKYALNPHETVKLFQEIILLNWVAIMIKESGSFVGAGTGIATRTVEKVEERLK